MRNGFLFILSFGALVCAGAAIVIKTNVTINSESLLIASSSCTQKVSASAAADAPARPEATATLRNRLFRLVNRSLLVPIHWISRVLTGNEHVDRRHHEQSEDSADKHSTDQHDTDAVACAGARPVREDQGEVSGDGRGRGHHDGPQSRARSFDHSGELVLARLLEVVSELHDQDAVLRYQSHQRDQTNLAVNVQRGESQERKHQRARKCEWHRSNKDDERIAEALELRRQN